jgi:hypothetical protein
MKIKGTAIAKFSNGTPVTLMGEWNIDTEIPAFRAYGQGDGTPGSGYIGADLGTRMGVSGAFKFVVDGSGEIIKQTIQMGHMGFFTIDWPIGDPNLGASKGKAIDAHFDKLSFAVDNPEGKYIISGTMSAGTVTGPAFVAIAPA